MPCSPDTMRSFGMADRNATTAQPAAMASSTETGVPSV
jgi:hypothetical protein